MKIVCFVLLASYVFDFGQCHSVNPVSDSPPIVAEIDTDGIDIDHPLNYHPVWQMMTESDVVSIQKYTQDYKYNFLLMQTNRQGTT